MTQEEKQMLSDVNEKLNQLLDVFYKTNLPDNQIFEKNITTLGKLIVNKGARFQSPSLKDSAAPEIRGGSAIGDTAIKAEIGYTSPNGSLYLCTSAAQPLFVMIGTTWTVANI